MGTIIGVIKNGKYYNLEKGEYPPPDAEKFGEAPFVIQDTIAPYRHPGTGQVVESRAALIAADKASGCITSDRPLPADPTWQNERRAKERKELRADLEKAAYQVDHGTAPLTEELRHVCAERNAGLSRALGIDAFNAVGKKNDPRGKKYRKPKI